MWAILLNLIDTLKIKPPEYIVHAIEKANFMHQQAILGLRFISTHLSAQQPCPSLYYLYLYS